MTQVTNIVPFDATDSAAIFAPEDFALNQAAEEFASVKFPVVSTKGGRFHIKRDGVKKLITRIKAKPTDPDEPSSYIDVVVLNFQKAKTFYLEGYTEGSEDSPDCYSNDAIKPDVQSKDPQCSTCALCPHNVWGSGTNDKGEATKGKACADTLRTAIATPSSIDDPYMLRVPPASLKNFSEMAKFVSSKRTPLNCAVVRIAFDTDKTGVMTFDAIGKLDAATFATAKAATETDLVMSIVGKKTNFVALAQLAAPAKVAQIAAPVVDLEAEKKAKAKAAKAAKLAAAQAALAAAEADDDEEPIAPVAETVAAAAPVKAKTPTATSDTFDAELAALLA